MKLYAIRDRLVDYYMQPFVGPSDAQVRAAVAENVNNPRSEHAVSQAPQHFELWRLAEVDEQTGQVQGDREFLCDLNSLVRGDVRERRDSAAAPIPRPLGGERRAVDQALDGANPAQRPPPGATQAETGQGAEAPARPGRTA